jgi:hypothetical protein
MEALAIAMTKLLSEPIPRFRRILHCGLEFTNHFHREEAGQDPKEVMKEMRTMEKLHEVN